MSPARRSKDEGTTAFRIKVRGKDGAPLSMSDVRAGLFEATRKLSAYENVIAQSG